eukprot:7120061-Ditylum_brightwellii.AAC.1
MYQKEEEDNHKHLLALKEQRESGEYDLNLLTLISLYQRADWDETHPKVRIGSIMKGVQGHGSFNNEKKQWIIPKLNPFVHTNQKVVSHEYYEKQICVEMLNVRSSVSERVWTKKVSRDDGELWEGDEVTEVKESRSICRKNHKEL